MLHPGDRAAPALAPSATSRRVDRQRAIRHGERPASVAEHRVAVVVEHRVAAVAADRMVAAVAAGIINQSSALFSVARKIWKWRDSICGERG